MSQSWTSLGICRREIKCCSNNGMSLSAANIKGTCNQIAKTQNENNFTKLRNKNNLYRSVDVSNGQVL